jgi:hypothetical protein
MWYVVIISVGQVPQREARILGVEARVRTVDSGQPMLDALATALFQSGPKFMPGA